MSDLLVVLGATGTQGASVMHHVRHRYPDLHIRALTRNPSSSAGQALSKQKNIEVVAADLGDEASLRAAFKDATIIFALTDYWSLWATHHTTGHPDPWTAAHADELRHGRNIADAAAYTLSASASCSIDKPGLRQLIFSSLPSPTAVSDGDARFSGANSMAHFEAKAEVEGYIRSLHPSRSSLSSSPPIVAKQRRLSDVSTIIWPTYYMENFTRWTLNAYLQPQRQDTGTGATYTLRTSLSPSTPLTLLAGSADYGRFVAAALSPFISSSSSSSSSVFSSVPSSSSPPSPPSPPSLDVSAPVLAASQTLTFPQITAVLSSHLGVEIRYERSAPGAMEASWGTFGRVFDAMYEYYNAFGFCGEVQTRQAGELGILTSELTTFEDFVAAQNWEGFLPAQQQE